MPLLKIDLLPAWVKERKAIRAALVLGGICLAAVLALCLLYAGMLTNRVNERKRTRDEKQRLAAQVDDLQRQLNDVKAQIDPVRARIDFCHAVENSGRVVAEKILAIKPYIWKDVRLASWTMSGSTCSMAGTILSRDPARRLESSTLARLWLNFSQCPEFVPGSVNINPSDWTGWVFPGVVPTGAGGTFGNPTFSMTAQLKTPLAMPVFGAAPQRAAGAPAAPGAAAQVTGPPAPAAPAGVGRRAEEEGGGEGGKKG